MNIWEVDKLFLFIAFVIPGFISLKVYELLNPGVEKESSKQIIDAIAYSCINYAILFWPIVKVESGTLRQNSPNLYAVFYLTVLFLFPIIWVLLWQWIRTKKIVQKAIPHPTQKPWDYVFSKREPYWIKAILKNGTIIAGKYAENSFASSSPAQEQIYLEEAWIINNKGGFERKKKQTAGVIILSSEIAYVELFKYFQEGLENDRRAETNK